MYWEYSFIIVMLITETLNLGCDQKRTEELLK